jgi:lipopolysaccharide transport system ATP-binding protein
MSFAIRVDNLGKRYRLGATHAGSIREVVNRAWKRVFGRRQALLPHEEARLRGISDRTVEEDGSFWALRDLSFEVKPGEVVGIIGRNGSGKSTLLKILSQITAPTTGRAELHGRVASLLEVGTGFHPELSGRENVFLNGAILGMTKAEIRRKFDEIVAFAEIEQFIDTPVKRYSSGMYVRLAFAVAAHLEPEILIIDEVLAVGDIKFQKKCLESVSAVTRKGRTVLLVSHNMGVVGGIASSAMLLEQGCVRAIGTTAAVVDQYTTSFFGHGQIATHGIADRLSRTNGKVQFTSVRLFDEEGNSTSTFRRDQSIIFELALIRKAPVDGLKLVLYLMNTNSVPMASLRITLDENPMWESKTLRVRVDANQIKSGEYCLYLALGNATLESFFDVVDDNVGLPPLTILPPAKFTRDDDAYINLQGGLA